MTTAESQPSATPGAPSDRLSPEVRRVSVVVVLGTIMAILDTTIVAVALATLARDFHTSISTIQWVTTGYLLALAVVIPLSGWAVHRFGAKPVYIMSLLLFVAGSALCGVAWSAGALIVFRVLQGLGGGMIMPVGQTIMVRTAGPDKMNKVMALIGVPTLLGPILGPVIGGLIISNVSWRWIFFVNVPIGIVALILCFRFLTTTPRDRSHRFDVTGFLLLAPGLALAVYGLSEVGSEGGFSSRGVQVSLLVSVVLIVGFVVRSLRAPEPLLDLRLFTRFNFSVATACIFLIGATLYGTMFLLPLYYQIVRGESPLTAGLLMAPQGIGAALVMRPSAQLADRYGTRRTVPVGMAVLALGTLAYTQVSGSTSFAFLACALLVRGIGLGFAMMPVFAAAYRGLSHEQVPRASTATNIIRQVGGSLGVAVFAVVLQTAIAHQFPGHAAGLGMLQVHPLPLTVADRLADAFATSFWWSFGVCALAILPAVFLPGPLTSAAGVWEELEEAEVANLDEVAEVIPE
ncbi:MAG TPA: MDR family MFS transporter [Acidimicrobiales bacterium]|nr:MDR family MFS transporter [Acidimicrobiales bacterium]